jgi:paraquat-inducible protein B
MSKIIYEASAIADTYKDKATGEERKRWVKCGVVMETSSGGMALKLESLPVKFDGWLQFYVPKPKDDKQQSNSAPAPQQSASEDDIPF